MAQRHLHYAALLLASGVVTSCGDLTGCGFDERTYSLLRYGMSQDDVVQLTGCRGSLTWPSEKRKDDKSKYRSWTGPGAPVTIEFEDGYVRGWRRT